MYRLATAGSRGAIATLENGRSLRTLDGGRTWRSYQWLYRANFATAKVGLGWRDTSLLSRARLTLMATGDGGRTWQSRASPCPASLSVYALVDLVTVRLGWMACVSQGGAGEELKAVYRTLDGGRTWRKDAGGLSVSGYVAGIVFTPGGFGLVWLNRGTLYVTRDGGEHWTTRHNIVAPEIDWGQAGAVFPDGKGLLLVLHTARTPATNTLLATSDYGATWHLVHRW